MVEKSRAYNQNSLKLTNIEDLEIKSGANCVVLTHSHDLDFEIVNHLCHRKDLTYIGLIGSQSKWLRFQKRLREAGKK